MYRVHWTARGQKFMSNPKTIQEVAIMLASLLLDPEVSDPYYE